MPTRGCRAVFVLVALVGLELIGPGAALAQGQTLTPTEAKALEHYKRGSSLLVGGDARGAIPELEASRSLYPSPNTDLVLAHAHRELGERVEALELYEAVVTSALGKPEFADAGAEAKKWSIALGAELGRVVVMAPKGAEIHVKDGAGKTRVLSRKEAIVEPGRVTVTATIGGKPVSRALDVAKGSRATVELEGPRDVKVVSDAAPSTGLGPLGIGAIVVGGFGAIGVGLFIGFGLSVRSAEADLDACDGPCSPELMEVRDRGARDQIIANVSLGFGIAAGAASIALGIASVFVRPSTNTAILPFVHDVPSGAVAGVSLELP